MKDVFIAPEIAALDWSATPQGYKPYKVLIFCEKEQPNQQWWCESEEEYKKKLAEFSARPDFLEIRAIVGYGKHL